MKHLSQARYPAPPDVVMRMFSDVNFHTRKLEQMGFSSFRVLGHSFDGKDFRIKVERKVPMQVPGLLKKVVPSESTAINEESWNVQAGTGRVVVEPVGMPLEISCVARIEAHGQECLISYDWTIKARIPLVGGALEKFVASDMDKHFARETAIAVSLLRDYQKIS